MELRKSPNENDWNSQFIGLIPSFLRKSNANAKARKGMGHATSREGGPSTVLRVGSDSFDNSFHHHGIDHVSQFESPTTRA